MFLLLPIFLLFSSPVFAATVFYDEVTKLEVYDESDSKTKEQIKEQFKLSDVEKIKVKVLKNGEGHKIVGNNIESYNIEEENDIIKDEKDKEKQKKIDKIKTKLSLTDQEFDDLKESLK